MNTVYVARDPVDAELVRQLLEDNGIEAVVRDTFVWLATTPFPSIAVRDEDAERAKEVIATNRG
ncbi:MAG TPA: DUF2007 domain-containing protein [Gemmatimonadales bacterium]|nr:DUF2007 domain-containing protein [Gemmatimonadales bacterium]